MLQPYSGANMACVVLLRGPLTDATAAPPRMVSGGAENERITIDPSMPRPLLLPLSLLLLLLPLPVPAAAAGCDLNQMLAAALPHPCHHLVMLLRALRLLLLLLQLLLLAVPAAAALLLTEHAPRSTTTSPTHLSTFITMTLRAPCASRSLW